MKEPDDLKLYRALLDSLGGGVYFTDREGRVGFWNRSAEELTGYSADEVMGRRCEDEILLHTDEQGHPLCKTPYCPSNLVLSDGTTREQLVYLRHRNGHRVPVMARTSPLRMENGDTVGAVVFISDASRAQFDKKRLEAMETAALIDPLTGMSNRRHAEMVLREKIGTFQRHGLRFGVLFVDVDHFKEINDSHGHEVGDSVLKMVAETLNHGVREADLVARWGGEEFLVVLTGCSEDDLSATAEKLRRLVENSALPTKTVSIRLTVSIGAAPVPPPASDISEIVTRADQLMYEAKRAGRNRVCVENDPLCRLERSSA